MKSVAVFLALFGLAVAGPVEPRAATCGTGYDFSTVGEQWTFRSPNWPGSYPANANCNYRWNSPPGSRISISCTEFNVEYSSSCVYDKFILSLTGSATLSDGIAACGQGTFTQQSSTNALSVGFRSDGSNPASNSLYRFQCTITAVAGPATTTTVAPATAAPVTAAPTTAAPAAAPAAAAATATSSPSTSANPNCNCGSRNVARIVGGTEASPNEFPWRVAMYSPELGGVFCGGTLIDNSWVLTAAHCINALPAGATLYADLADHDLTTLNETKNQVIKCDRFFTHSAYNSTSQDNDMALCHLQTPATYSKNISPACLPFSMSTQTFQGKTVTASGWGTTSSGGNQALTMRKVDLPVKTTEECRQYYPTQLTDNMICTYSPGKDTCQGDSGGSIDYQNPASGKYYAIGVVSWGYGCAGVNEPGVYAKVTNYLSWLETQTGANFCKA